MAAILDRLSVRHAALLLSVEQYHRLNEEGILSERTELLRGVIIERMTKSPLHTRLATTRKVRYGNVRVPVYILLLQRLRDWQLQ
jgi:hypothetical protein